MIFYFSGTGNSKWVAQETAKEQNETLCFIPNAIKEQKFRYQATENEKIGFVFPIYSWGPPTIILDFIRQMQLETDDTNYIFFICTCGDDIGLSKEILIKSLRNKQLECNSGFSIIMPNNYILMKGFDTDPKSLEKKKLCEAEIRTREINEKITKQINGLFECKQGKFAFIKTRIIWPLFNKFQVSDNAFYATDQCNSCRICEKTCPVSNIKVNEKPQWEHHCVLCLSCIHRCPQNAIQYGKETTKKGRYYFGKK